eukprot:COSAG05_NODE_994_length_6264_cov_3.618329_5_plen_223_part_00
MCVLGRYFALSDAKILRYAAKDKPDERDNNGGDDDLAGEDSDGDDDCFCDGCGDDDAPPLVGVRYTKRDDEDYDLCQSCYDGLAEDEVELYEKIKIPKKKAKKAGKGAAKKPKKARPETVMDLLEIDGVSRPRQDGYFEVKIHGRPRWRLQCIDGGYEEADKWYRTLLALTPTIKGWLYINVWATTITDMGEEPAPAQEDSVVSGVLTELGISFGTGTRAQI